MASLMTDLRDWLKAHNIKNSMGGELSYNTIQRMLSNRRYIGELRLRDVVQPNAIPALVSGELVGARPLHLAYARPFGRLKAPLGLSLLRCAPQTRTFENTLISAACKKTQGKLWQKERGPDGASPLDRMMRCSKISAAFIAVFKNSAEQNGIFTICRLRILLRWENRIRQKDKVSAGKIRTRQ